MKFEDVLPAFREGKKIRRKLFGDTGMAWSRDTLDEIDSIDLLADDWEEVEEPKKSTIAYPVLFKDTYADGTISREVFVDFDRAREWAGINFIRMVTEMPITIEELP